MSSIGPQKAAPPPKKKKKEKIEKKLFEMIHFVVMLYSSFGQVSFSSLWTFKSLFYFFELEDSRYSLME